MNNSFYQLNSAVLYFDEKNDINKIRFNHYIMRRENIQRLKGTLPRGQFFMTVRKTASDLGLSISTISRLVKEFIRLGILKFISRGIKGKSCSVYSYICSEINNMNISGNDSDCERTDTMNSSLGTNNDMLKSVKHEVNNKSCKYRDINDYDYIIEDITKVDLYDENYVQDETQNEIQSVTKKKELLKKKKLKKNNIKKNNISNNEDYGTQIISEDAKCVGECIIHKLNEKSGKNFKADSFMTRKLINERLEEGYTISDFYKVIDIKVEQWKDSFMDVYIRPETLFSHKFESYVNENTISNATDKDKTYIGSKMYDRGEIIETRTRDASYDKYNRDDIPFWNPVCDF